MKFERDPDLVNWFNTLAINERTFQWDRGNATKNLKHGVKKEEIMEIFYSPSILGGRIVEPFHPENRWILFGETAIGRKLSLIFTVRDGLIRPISCRPMRRKEAKFYEEEI